MKLQKQAAAFGDNKTQHWLDERYKYGFRVECDETKAFWCYRQAAIAGNQEDNPKSGCAVDTEVHWLQKAEVHGVGDALVELEQLEGRWHYNVVIRADKAKLYREAVSMLQKTVDVVGSAAAVEYAVCCENGYGVEADKTKTFYLYIKYPKTMEDDVQFYLAHCNEKESKTTRNLQKTAKMYYSLVKSGHAKALRRLVIMHYNGVFGDPHSEEAIQVYMQGLEKQNVDAMCELARCCYENRVSDEIVQQIVQSKVFQAIMFEKARKYANGLAEPDSDCEAFYVFKQVENHNDPDVLCAIGRAYQFGWGVKKDITKAIEYYVKAADAGLFEAMNRLRDCKDYNVDKQLKAAFEHFKQQAAAGNTNAQFAVAACHHYGIGVVQSCKAAIEMCQAASNYYNGNVMVLLGYMYEYGHGVEENKIKAVELYKQAAEAGNGEGQYRLGECYCNAVGVGKDCEKSVFWYRKAAARGHAYAANKLGDCYRNGYGVRENLSKAFQYCKQAALAGNDSGQRNTGNCYHYGYGVGQSYKRAAYWFKKAADHGDMFAAQGCAYCIEYLAKTRNIRTSILETGITESINMDYHHVIGFHLARSAAEFGCGRAFSCLGDCYFSETGTEIVFTAAANCYKRVEPLDSQKYFNLVRCLETGLVDDKTEIQLFSALKQANAALRTEINEFLSYMY